MRQRAWQLRMLSYDETSFEEYRNYSNKRRPQISAAFEAAKFL